MELKTTISGKIAGPDALPYSMLAADLNKDGKPEKDSPQPGWAGGRKRNDR
ncbi:MAG: hypothetical protein ABSE84_29775 [Isosphaeraceae bacterium]|jgi:hypothetical protein